MVTGTAGGQEIDAELAEAFAVAYTGVQALRCGFSYYRAMEQTGRQVADAAADGRLTVPTMAIGARPVGDVLYRQLVPVTDRLVGHLVEDCCHLIPLDQPQELLRLVLPFLTADLQS